jgi:predicted glutamine amidotransferase
MIIQQFQNQRLRGIEGFGVFDGQFKNIVKTPYENKILDWLKRYPSKELLFHHRMPTSTDNVKNACHPFSTHKFFKTNYILVHNGWISNASELYEKHKKLGIVYASEQIDGRFNDSEALLWDFALYKEGKQTAMQARGPVAFICIALDKSGDKLYYARNSNPLKIHRTKKHILLSSEGKGIMIEAYKLHSFDYKTREVTKEDITLAQYIYSGGDYNPHTSGFGYSGGDNGGWYDTDGKYHAWSYNPRHAYDEDDEFAEIQSIIGEKDELGLDDEPDDYEKEIQEIYYEYLERVNGVFEDMFYMVQADIEMTSSQPDDPAAVSETMKLEAVLDRLVSIKIWDEQTPVHPSYAKTPSQSLITSLTKQVLRG